MKPKDRITNWINTVLDELSILDNQKGNDILNVCGSECAKLGNLFEKARLVREKFKTNQDIDEIFKAFKKEYYNSKNLIKKGNQITLIFEECTCPLFKEGVNHPFLCHCTQGYTKKIFETLFEHSIHVELEQSVLKGGLICKQIITLL